MAGPKPATRVEVISPTGERGTVAPDDVPHLPDGARVLTAQELAQERVQARYANRSLAEKAIAFGITGDITPEAGAYREAAQSAASAGVIPAATRVALDTVGPPGAGDKYAQRVDDIGTASPNVSTAGSVAGFLGGTAITMATGGASGAAGALGRAAPMGAISAAGAPVEAAVARGLAGLGAKGALGRAAQQGAAMAVRGAAEGAVYSGVEQAASDVLHDEHTTGSKLYSSASHGALLGAGLGGALGVTGSLLGSGVRGLQARRASRLALEEGRVPPPPVGVEVPFIDADAGLKTAPGKAESPFSIGAERRPVQLRPGGRARADASESPISITGRMTIDPDAGLFAPSGRGDGTTFRQRVPEIPSEPSPGHVRVYHSGPERISSFRPDTSFALTPKESIPYLEGRRGWMTYADLPEASVASERQLREISEEIGKRFDYAFEMADDTGVQKALTDRGYKAVRYQDMGPENAYEHATVRVLTGDAKPTGHARVSPSGRQTGRTGVGPREVTMPTDADLSPIRLASRPVRQRFDIGLDADAGLAAASKSEDAFRLSSAKQVPHNIDARFNESLDPFASTSPIRLPSVEAPSLGGAVAAETRPFLKGMLDAGEQAWRAVGGGFGLQSTRYAKEAAKHFGSTAELGQVALKHGLIDMGGEAATPMAAAWQAAKNGTPADILPRAQLATETVGKKLGELTASSGARVAVDDAVASAVSVANTYAGQAGRSGLRNAALQYGEELRGVLRPGADGKVAVQDLLEQRRILDDIVFEEAKTLDPKGRVKALREVRSKLESTIATALDEASGRMPGELRAEYNDLKRDYHGLRILSEAAEDSAARASKGSMFGLGEKFAIGSAVASGNFTAAPVLAVGGKMLRERGNAAAAAFLSRASTRGTFDGMVRAFNQRFDVAAAGVLSSGDKTMTPRVRLEAPTVAPSRTTSRTSGGPAAVAASREFERRTQAQAQAIVQWVGDANANPTRLAERLEEVAAEISQAVGPKAAEGYSASTMRAIAFVSGYIPIKERRDPLDPRSVPPLMRDEAIRLVRAAKYAFQPETIYEDFGRGVITPEGLRAAKFIDPDTFEEFQLKLQNHVENHMLRNRQLTQSQRLRIDKLLGYPAGADLRPKSIARRQANYSDVAMNDPAGSPPAPTGNGPVNMNTQQSGFDAIESRMAG